MTVRYDIYESPTSDKSDKKSNAHARVVTDGTVDLENLAERIAFSSSVTIGDVKSVLSSLSHYFAESLGDGRRVHINGLGYFSLTLSCAPAASLLNVKSHAVKFRSVAFRPDKALKEKLVKTEFLFSAKKNMISYTFSEEKLEAFLTDHFKTNRNITCTYLARFGNLTKFMARKQLARLVEEGKLMKEGNNRFPYYVPAKGFYGRE